MSKKKAFLLFAMAMAAMGLVVGCSCEEPPKPKPTPAKSQAAKPAPAPIAKAPAIPKAPPIPTFAEQLAAKSDIPDDYPEDGVVYPGSHASTSVTKDGRLSVIFSSPDPVDKIIAFTSNFLDEEGWEQSSPTSIPPNGTLLRGDKDDGRVIVVLISRIEEAGRDPVTMIAVAIDP